MCFNASNKGHFIASSVDATRLNGRKSVCPPYTNRFTVNFLPRLVLELSKHNKPLDRLGIKSTESHHVAGERCSRIHGEYFSLRVINQVEDHYTQMRWKKTSDTWTRLSLRKENTYTHRCRTCIAVHSGQEVDLSPSPWTHIQDINPGCRPRPRRMLRRECRR